MRNKVLYVVFATGFLYGITFSDFVYGRSPGTSLGFAALATSAALHLIRSSREQ